MFKTIFKIIDYIKSLWRGDKMKNDLLSVLKKCGYRENLDCSDINVLNLEIDLHPSAERQLKELGVNIQHNIKIADENDPLKLHSLYTTGATKEYGNGCHVALYENDIDAFIEWNNRYYDIVGMSISAFNASDVAQTKMNETSYLIASAGNSGKGGIYDTKKHWDLIGACDLYNKMRPYSSYDKIGDVDYVGYDGFVYKNETLYGTSFSRIPETILLIQASKLFLDKYGVRWTPKQMSKFVARHCIDIDQSGFDVKSGAGLFVLPSDRDIKFFEHIDISQEVIDSIRVIESESGTKKIVISDKHIDLMENKKVNASYLAYLVRRKMAELRLDMSNIVYDLHTMPANKFMKYITNPSIMTEKMENGKA